jgi:hypothetical protein
MTCACNVQSFIETAWPGYFRLSRRESGEGLGNGITNNETSTGPKWASLDARSPSWREEESLDFTREEVPEPRQGFHGLTIYVVGTRKIGTLTCFIDREAMRGTDE